MLYYVVSILYELCTIHMYENKHFKCIACYIYIHRLNPTVTSFSMFFFFLSFLVIACCCLIYLYIQKPKKRVRWARSLFISVFLHKQLRISCKIKMVKKCVDPICHQLQGNERHTATENKMKPCHKPQAHSWRRRTKKKKHHRIVDECTHEQLK